MKKNVFRYSGLLFVLVSLLLVSCSKEEWDPIDPDPFITGMIGNVSATSLEGNVQWMQNMNSRFALSDNRRAVAVQLLQKFSSYGYANARLDSFYLSCEFDGELYDTWQYNVVVTLPGYGAPDSICVIGAHYDCINDEGDPWSDAPGADDNASGVAAMLEIARVMKAENYAPRTTIEFVAFAAEELDLYGSADYAGKAAAQGRKIRLMLNEDMIGYEPSSNPGQWQINIMDYSNSKDLRACAEQVALAYTSLTPYTDNRWNQDSDSYSFYQNGFEALFFLADSENPDYHTGNDLVSNLNFEYCREATKLSCALLLYLN